MSIQISDKMIERATAEAKRQHDDALLKAFAGEKEIWLEGYFDIGAILRAALTETKS